MTDLERTALDRFVILRNEARRCLCVLQRVEATETGVWVRCPRSCSVGYEVWFSNISLTERAEARA